MMQMKSVAVRGPNGVPVPNLSGVGLLGRTADVDALAAGLARSSFHVGSLPDGGAGPFAAFAKQNVPSGGAVPGHGAASGGLLAAALRSANAGVHASGVGDPLPVIGSWGRKSGLVLATSFRDPCMMPPPLPLAVTAETEEEEDSAEEEERGRGGRARPDMGGEEEEEEEEDEEAAARRRAERESGAEHEGVFDMS